MYYQSDALHWNLSQIDDVDKLGQKALESYLDTSEGIDVEMRSSKSAEGGRNQLIEMLDILKKEANMNGFGLVINDESFA